MELTNQSRIAPRLIDAIYTDAMLLADEARAYFNGGSIADRDALSPLSRVMLSCEAMRITTRLMHVLAWLLTRRSIEAGEIAAGPARDQVRKLSPAEDSDPASYADLPTTARQLIEASRELYARVSRLDAGIDAELSAISPARGLLSRLERAF